MANTLLDNAASVAIALTFACGALGWMGNKFWRFIQRIARFMDDYEGTAARNGVDKRPGVMERLAALESSTKDHNAILVQQSDTLAKQNDQLELIVHQVTADSGTSMMDKVNALWEHFIEKNEDEG